MIFYKNKYGCSISEIWYNRNIIPSKKTDILFFKFVDKILDKAWFIENLFTLEINLSQSEDTIFSFIRKNTKYEIKRALTKDNIKCETFLFFDKKDLNKVNQYLDFYNKFADSKNRSHLSFSDVEQFYNTDTLCIRQATTEDNSEILCMHAYLLADGRSRLLQSSSHFRDFDNPDFRNLNARANRLLHWDDIQYFKNLGISCYDFGGWYGGTELKEQILINQFKESFGGIKKQEYSYIIPVTIKGYFYILIRFFLKKTLNLFHKHV